MKKCAADLYAQHQNGALPAQAREHFEDLDAAQLRRALFHLRAMMAFGVSAIEVIIREYRPWASVYAERFVDEGGYVRCMRRVAAYTRQELDR
jgi:hypothetical protein